MNKTVTLLSGAGLGAGLMYLMDPQWGRRRRALMMDQVNSLMRQAGDAVAPTGRDLSNRARGLAAETAARVTGRDNSDYVVEQRVRSKMGRYVSHPRAIDVTVNQGHVTLTGPILAHEADGLLAALRAVPGVKSVNNQLETHQQAGNISALQGGRVRPGERFALFQENWSPTTRFLVGGSGGALALYGAMRQGAIGTALSALGFGLVARTLANLPTRRMFGVEAGRRAIDIQKTININAPVEEVFAYWSNFENFPHFMSHVHEVRDLGNDRSRWTVDGPAGIPVSWEATITRYIPNRLLAWRSEPGSTVANAGIVRLSPNPNGGTQVNVQMSYNPPAGALGHAVAAFFGSDPKRTMNEDLMRLKSLLEQGETTAGGRTVTRDQMEPMRVGIYGTNE